jgi:hypothetical protein
MRTAWRAHRRVHSLCTLPEPVQDSGSRTANRPANSTGEVQQELWLELQQDHHDFKVALRQKTDGRPTKAGIASTSTEHTAWVTSHSRRRGKVSFSDPKEEPVCCDPCERCVSAAWSLPGWLFGGCKIADGTPGDYDDTTPPLANPNPRCPWPSGDTDDTITLSTSTSSGSSSSLRQFQNINAGINTPWILHQYSIMNTAESDKVAPFGSIDQYRHQ